MRYVIKTVHTGAVQAECFAVFKATANLSWSSCRAEIVRDTGSKDTGRHAIIYLQKAGWQPVPAVWTQSPLLSSLLQWDSIADIPTRNANGNWLLISIRRIDILATGITFGFCFLRNYNQRCSKEYIADEKSSELIKESWLKRSM